MLENTKGIVAPAMLVVLAAAGLIAYFLVSSSFPFKNELLSKLYPKPPAKAEGSIFPCDRPTQVRIGDENPAYTCLPQNGCIKTPYARYQYTTDQNGDGVADPANQYDQPWCDNNCADPVKYCDGVGSSPPPSGSACASNECYKCILDVRPDVITNYGSWGWDTSCGNQNNIAIDWCTNLDYDACESIKKTTCASVCGYSTPPPTSCTNPTGSEGDWRYSCTTNTCPTDPNAGVGVPYRCESGQWVNKNPSGECTNQCQPSGGGTSPTPTPITGCTNPTGSEGSWRYECTTNTCPTNSKQGVGIPYRCESGQWINKNPSGECTNKCQPSGYTSGCTNPTGTEGSFRYVCTTNTCPTDPNAGVGVPYQCQNGQWVSTNTNGECTTQCQPSGGGGCQTQNCSITRQNTNCPSGQEVCSGTGTSNSCTYVEGCSKCQCVDAPAPVPQDKKNTCDNRYPMSLLQKNPLKANFGDPECNFTKYGLFDVVKNYDPGRENVWMCMAYEESKYNPNAYCNESWCSSFWPKAGVWGLFQMGACNNKENDSNDGCKYDRGDVIWNQQAYNAIMYSKTKLNGGLGYWPWASQNCSANNYSWPK